MPSENCWQIQTQHYELDFWLEVVPKYAVSFTQLVILASFTDALSAPLWTAIGATGRINKYQLWVSIILLLDIPIVYFVLKLGCTPVYTFYINLIISVIAYLFRVIYIQRYIGYKLSNYCTQVIFPCMIVTIVSIIIPLLLKSYINSFISTILYILLTLITTTLTIIILGMNKRERLFVINNILKFKQLKG